MQSLTFICYVKGLLVKVLLFELMAGWPSGELVVKLVSQCRKVHASSSDLISQTSCQHQAVMRIKYSLVSLVSYIYSMYDQAILIELLIRNQLGEEVGSAIFGILVFYSHLK